ncbi:MAG TPA: aminotransferase class V-fold PLP-dependent enzyme [Gemmatimonadaceae bacterium]|jgi:selenocysteine lyase/cysteine desulfurase|nr:aminotransferase class V-fold PLP-dependent enzyme [Gemmatimonadaceae bacterium]
MTTRELAGAHAAHDGQSADSVLPCQRALFSIPDNRHYLNCAYMAPLARSVEAAGQAGLLRQRDPSQVGPAMFFDDVDRVRALFARLIGVDDWERVALVPSVSYAVQIVTANSRAQTGQNVVVIGDEFASAVLPWHRLALERRLIVRTVAAPAGVDVAERAAVWSEGIAAAIDADTAAVMLAPVHWSDGTRFDLVSIAARARAVGADVVVDGTQAVGALPFDFDAVRPDAVVCSGYKWLLGGYGMALAYLGPTYDGGIPLEENWTSQVGSEDFAQLSDYRHEYRQHVGRYDGGERAKPVLMAMMEAALTQLLAWGVDRVQRYCAEIIAPLRARAEELRLVVDTSAARSSHIVGVRFADGRSAVSVGRELTARQVYVSVRGDAIRVAPHLYTDARDVGALIDGLAARR